MNISAEVYKEAAKRGLDFMGTGGGFDYICRTIKDDVISGQTRTRRNCQMTLSSLENHGMSPQKLDEKCEIGIALHATGFLSIGLCFNNVPDALDFMQKTSCVYFLPDMYKSGLKEFEATAEGLRE